MYFFPVDVQVRDSERINPTPTLASVLLIDDDEALRNVTVEILQEAGYDVDDAPDGRSGLELFRIGLHDVVITDIAMPDMDGIELIIDLTRAAPVSYTHLTLPTNREV